MKKLYLIPILLFAVSTVHGQFRGDVTVERRALEERGDSLHMELDIRIRGLAMNKCQSWTIIPELSTPGKENVLLFPHVQINGRNKQQIARRSRRLTGAYWNERQPYQTVNVNKETDELVEYVMDVPYEVWMDHASLKLQQILTSCNEQRQLFTTDIRGGIDFEAYDPYQPQVALNFFEPAAEQKSRHVQGQAYLDFPAGKSAILPDFRKNPEELEKIRATIEGVRGDKDVTITALYIDGYASPEGAYESNDRLSRERAEALKQYISANFGISESLIRASNTAEDWAGLRTLVEESTLADKEQVLGIIDSQVAPDVKEEKLKRTASWFKLLLRMFPSLRRTDYQVDYTIRDYDTAEARELAQRDPDKLSHREMYLAAKAGGPSAFYDMLTDRILRRYSDDPTARINAAAALIQRGDNASARRLLEKVKTDPRVANNFGALCLKEGNLEQAKIWLEQAADAGSAEARLNLLELAKVEADKQKMQRYLDRMAQ